MKHLNELAYENSLLKRMDTGLSLENTRVEGCHREKLSGGLSDGLQIQSGWRAVKLDLATHYKLRIDWVRQEALVIAALMMITKQPRRKF